MNSASDHRRGKMVGTGYHVSDDFGLGGVGNGRFEHANNGGGAGAKANVFADYRGIALEHGAPEAGREDRGACSVGAVVLRAKQSAEDRTQPHHVEVRSSDYASADLTGLTK